ncbi:MAG TPA: hypothetical protein VN176_04235 [Verrucomicrobiae bacterium]|jgi:hypothetical protein|nr:hypothetical protein [Verrucomicrobiae bacterium]
MKALALNAVGRGFDFEDIQIAVAVFLASDDAGWLTGEIIFAGGGLK